MIAFVVFFNLQPGAEMKYIQTGLYTILAVACSVGLLLMLNLLMVEAAIAFAIAIPFAWMGMHVNVERFLCYPTVGRRVDFVQPQV